MIISQIAVKRPVTTIMSFSSLVLIGIISLLRLPVDMLPNVGRESISIAVSYDGAGPEEVEKLITEPMEKIVSTITGVEEVRSNSAEGRSRVTLNFIEGTNMMEAMNDVRERVGRIAPSFPEDADTPQLFRFDFSMLPVVTYGVSGPLDPVSLRDFADDFISRRLATVKGVANVSLVGGKIKEIRVELLRDRLQAYNLSIFDVVESIKRENLSLPGGIIESGQEELLVRTLFEFTTIEDLEEIIVARREGFSIPLKHLAKIHFAPVEMRNEVRLSNGNGIVMTVQKQSGTNTIEVADGLDKLLPFLIKELPAGVKIEKLFDSSLQIRSSIENLKNGIIVGGFLAILILVAFLNSFAATMVVAVSIPVSILITFIFMDRMHLTLNTLSLGGLALGVGMLVDNSIVVLESIFKKREQGLKALESAIAGTMEVGLAIFSSTLTTLCVFFPLIYIGGRAGILFKELAYTVSFSLISSLLVALTLTPVLCCLLIKKIPDEISIRERPYIGIFSRFLLMVLNQYRFFLDYCMKFSWKSIITAIVILLSSISLIPFIGTEFFPTMDEGEIKINFQYKPGTKLEVTNKKAKWLEGIVKQHVPEMQSMYAQVGVAEGYMGRGVDGSHQGTIQINLKKLSERKRNAEEIMSSLRQLIVEGPGETIKISSRGAILSRILGGGRGSRLSVDIVGYDLDKMDELAQIVMEKMKDVQGVINVEKNRADERPELQIILDKDIASYLSLSSSTIANAVRDSLDGKVASVFRENGKERNIRVILRKEDRLNEEDLYQLPLIKAENHLLSLKQLATFKRGMGPMSIERMNRQRFLSIEGQLTPGRSLGEVNKEIEKNLEDIVVPDGFMVELSGEHKEQDKSFTQLILTFVLSIILVYMVMCSQFESYLAPLVILISIPFSLVGVFYLLFWTNTTINIMSFIGVISLVGIVVNNAIILVDHYQTLPRPFSREDLIKGASMRFRPILMTTLTTILGLMPLALGLGEGSEMQSPLARTLVGGLLSSTFLTLILIPVIYEKFFKKMMVTHAQ